MLITPSQTSLQPAALEHRGALENLMQLYAYDWSEMLALDVGADGRFAGAKLDVYWGEEGHHPFLLRVDDALAGFALIGERSRLTNARGIFDMAEFFVLRRFRRQGVGLAAAFAAFDRFKGPWEIRQRAEARAATAFWQRAVRWCGAGQSGRDRCSASRRRERCSYSIKREMSCRSGRNRVGARRVAFSITPGQRAQSRNASRIPQHFVDGVGSSFVFTLEAMIQGKKPRLFGHRL